MRPLQYDPRACQIRHIQTVTLRDRFDWNYFWGVFVLVFVFVLVLFS